MLVRLRFKNVSAPVLYIKEGCPYCARAMDYLDEHEVAYDKIDVRGDEQKLAELKEVSGQTKTPTLVSDGRVLADFDVNELKDFLGEQEPARGA